MDSPWALGRGLHSRSGRQTERGWRRVPPVLLFVVVLAVAIGGGTAFALTAAHGSSRTAAHSNSPGVSTHGPAGAVSSTHHTPDFSVSGTSPANGATAVDPGATITVSLNAPLAANSPMPSLSPLVAGSWTQLSASKLQFAANAPFVPGTTETLTIPGGSGGLKGVGNHSLASPVTTSFTVAQGNELRLQEILAQLGYLPLQFTPASPVTPQNAADPQLGNFAWKWTTLPPSFMSQWTQGTDNVITKGAVMAFEDQHQLGVDGVAGPQVWSALLTALAQNKTNPVSYNDVLVSTAVPQTATVYENGAPAYNTPVNTGVAGAPTDPGTFPVYARFTSTTMSGTNPDGSKYSDPGIPWVSYFNGGDALHGFVRASYGTPQSDGCVEMPVANAQAVFPLTPLGTPVTVQ